MAANMANRMHRVQNVLESIGRDIRVAADLGLVETSDFAVPAGLRIAVARTAIVMIEAVNLDKYRAKKERENKKRLLQKRLEAFRKKHGRDPATDEKGDLDKSEKFAPQKAEKKKKKKKPAPAAGRGGSPPPPPPPPAAGAEAAGGDEGDDPYVSKKTGKKLTKAAALEVMAKRRREGKLGSGGPEEIRSKAKEGDVGAALAQAGEGLKEKMRQAKKPSTQFIKRPVVSPGRRQDMPMPPGEFPGQHRAHQADKAADLDWLEKERQRRGLGRGKIGDRDYAPAALKAKASKLRRMKFTHPAHRDRELDEPKGYDRREHPKWAGHHTGPDGKPVHSSGKKANKKFANATTFRDSDTDALLHTDKSKEGARADADTSEFVFHGDVKKDPREKWYRVSKEGGYASAMASLGKAYHKDPKMRSKVVSKVKQTGFVDGQGHQIDVKPTGALHNERGACVRDKGGRLSRVGKELQRRNPHEWSRLCKGAHGPSGTPDRNEYERGFDPRHDDAHKIRKLHKAAEAGKAEKPDKNIKAHADVRPGRRQDIHDYVRGIGRAATRTKWRMRNA